ncbi:DUF3278 domain-containing protein [Enterococcus sp. S86.2]|uniref:DUF3278 domain-containing protein n=1 Tax=Enterococcus sp. S86.2 TaxID=3031299 RepID=UPI0026F239A1|nr:DUF3278 domain-containing protein [Enterococcus sp. S86.2]
MMKITRDNVVKHFFGIEGTLDEYKRNEANRIGNNAFIGLYSYLLFSSLIALMFGLNHPENALYALLACNILTVVYGVGIYIMKASKSALLTENEVTSANVARVRKYNRKKGIQSAIYFGITIHLLQAVFSWVAGDGFLAYIISPFELIISCGAGILFGITTIFMMNAKISDIGKG